MFGLADKVLYRPLAEVDTKADRHKENLIQGSRATQNL